MYDPETIMGLSVIAALSEAPVEEMGVDGWNHLSSYWRDIARDGPAKVWWSLPHDHPAIARALRIDRSHSCAPYALAPFRYIKRGDRHLILAAHPCPRQFTPVDMDWLGIETVIAWEPSTGKVNVLTDDRPQLFGRVTDDNNTLFADPRAFFIAWMRARAWWATSRIEAAKSPWSAKPAELDMLPGALIVGDPDRIGWPVHTMPRHFECVGIEPKRINRAILKSAGLPMCVGADIARAA